jgi:hypothetical protein
MAREISAARALCNGSDAAEMFPGDVDVLRRSNTGAT